MIKIDWYKLFLDYIVFGFRIDNKKGSYIIQGVHYGRNSSNGYNYIFQIVLNYKCRTWCFADE